MQKIVFFFFFFSKYENKGYCSWKHSWNYNCLLFLKVWGQNVVVPQRAHGSGDGTGLISEFQPNSCMNCLLIFLTEFLFSGEEKGEEGGETPLKNTSLQPRQPSCIMDVYTYILTGYLMPPSLIVSVSSHKHTEVFFFLFLWAADEDELRVTCWWELMGALLRRCHRPLSAARPPNVNIDFTVWRSGKCVWDGYVHSGGPRRTVQGGRKSPEGPGVTVFTPLSRFWNTKKWNECVRFPQKESEADAHQMFDWE